MTLRPFLEADLPLFFEHQRDPEAARMAAFVPRDWEAFAAHWRANMIATSAVTRQTIVAASGEVAGYVASWERDGRRFIAYWIGREHWGRGVATEALAEFVARHDTSRPLFAYVAVANVGSLRVLEKCGFSRMGDAVTGADGVEEFLLRLA